MLRKLMDKMTTSTTYIGPAVSTMIGNQPLVSNSTLTGAINPNTYHQYTEMDYMTANPMNIQIHRAVNGFVVRCGVNQGNMYTVHIAKTMEEVNEIITTELVLKKMEGK
jgi:hypothetical protein